MNEIIRNAGKYSCILLALAMLSACQSGGPAENLNLSTTAKPLTLIVSIGKTMQKCWFRSGNPAFKSFRLANESNSHSGRPRLLLVAKNNPTGLPSLVVQAEKSNGATRLQVFGPLLSTNTGQTISTDLKNWTTGRTACAA